MTIEDLGNLGFHARDGWHFARLDDGSVRIIAPDSAGDGARQVIMLNPDSWASAVASVSAAGGTSDTFAAAQALHAGTSWQGPTITKPAATPRPTLGRTLHYRGNQGFLAPRAAVVTATIDSLDPRGVESGEVPALDSDQHVHLWVFTPGTKGGFAEFNVPRGEAPEGEETTAGTIPPGTWCWPPRA